MVQYCEDYGLCWTGNGDIITDKEPQVNLDPFLARDKMTSCTGPSRYSTLTIRKGSYSGQNITTIGQGSTLAQMSAKQIWNGCTAVVSYFSILVNFVKRDRLVHAMYSCTSSHDR